MTSRSLRFLVGSLWIAALLMLATPRTALAEFGDPIRGQTLFVEKGCVECHAVRGAGGRTGPDLGRAAFKDSFYEIAADMWNHSRAMGEKMIEFRLPRQRFDGNELGDLIAFLYFLNYFDEPGDPRIGKILFAEKHCIQCHTLGREGGSTGPRLDSLPRGTPPLEIAGALWNHGPDMVRSIRRMGLNLPVFYGSEINDLLAYLRSQGQRQTARDFRSAGDPTRGERLYAAKGCPRCHSIFGDGTDIGPDLGREELRGSVTQLAGRMWNHWPSMTEAMEALGMSLPTFEGDELADVFAFIFVSRYDGQPVRTDLGRDVYTRKGCAICHGARGEGRSGPALRGVTSDESKERIAQRMWNHATRMGEEMGNKKIPWPRFDAVEMAAVLSFLGEGLDEEESLPNAAGGSQ